MKKIVILLFTVLYAIGGLYAQERIIFYNGSIPVHTQYISNIDSVNFVNGVSIVHNNIGESDFQFPVVGIDSIVFTSEEEQIDTGDIIYITYAGNAVSIINPWANRGVTVTNNGADVTVTAQSGTQDIIYYLSGSTSDGSLAISSDYRFNLIMDGVSITNPTGAAIKVTDDVKVSVTLKNSSTLADGTGSTDKGPFSSKGQVVVSGSTGSLTVTGNVQHGFYSADYIRLLSGTLNVAGAVSDGIHSNDYIEIFGGTVNVTNAETGIDAGSHYINISGGNITINTSAEDGKGIKCDSLVTITGGTIDLTLSGSYSKGIKAGTDIDIQGGSITINGSGATVVTANDPSHCAGLKSNGATYISSITGNTDINITMTSAAAGGKAINADGNVTICGGTIELSVAGAGGTYTDSTNQSNSYSAQCIKTNGDITVSGGTLTITSSGTDSKGFSADNNITVNGGNLTFTASGIESKGMTADNTLTINDGTVNMTLSGNVSKGIKSDVAMLIAGGTLNITASGSTVVTSGDPAYCSGIKADGTLNITGGDLTITCTSTNTGGRCISSTGAMTVGGGTMTLKTQGSGTTYTSGSTTDGYGPVCIKTDGNFSVTAGVIDCQSTGTGGRGIKVDGITTIGVQGGDNDLIDIDIMTSGSPISGGGGGGWYPGGSSTNYCKPKGLKCLGNIYIHSGHISSYCAQTSGDPNGEAIESKDGIYINGGFIEANAFDDAINSANHLEMNGGYIWAYARGNDAIDCNGAYTQFNGGVVIAAGSEEGIDANTDGMGGTQGHLQINGATILAYKVSSGGGGGGGGFALLDNPTYSNGQKALSTSNVTTGNSYCIKNSSNNPVMIYQHPTVSGSGFQGSTSGLRPPGGNATFVFTSPDVTSGTYTLYSNPTISGTTHWHGLYIGASATTSGNGTSITAQ